jgi:hypothetical protein
VSHTANHGKRFLSRLLALAAALCAASAFAQNVVAPAPAGQGATTIYRQVMPDGRIVYSDKPLKGGKVDRTVTVEPAARAQPSAAAASARSKHNPAAQQKDPGATARPGAADEAEIKITRAEMLLDDAKRRQAAGTDPLPGERTHNAGGGSRLNEAYWARQQSLAKEVATAEEALRQAMAERDGTRQK